MTGTTAGTAYLSIEEGIATLVLNRPDKLNAIDQLMLRTMEECLAVAERDRAVRVLILRGAGRAFCAGGDLGSVRSTLDLFGELEDFMDGFHRVCDRLVESRLPSIAAVHGVCLAGGFELLQACDLAVLAQDTVLGDQHATYGLFPGGGGTQRLPRLIGERRAKWLIYSGESLAASDALQFGLVNRVCPEAEVLDEARSMARVLARRSPVATAGTKRAITDGLAAGTLSEGLQIERELASRCLGSDDARIGLDAFASRTVPEFRGT